MGFNSGFKGLIMGFFLTRRKRCRSQWPRGLSRRSGAARLLRSWVRIPPGAWIFVCCEHCVLSGRGLCDELITRPEESYRLWCVVVCNLENLKNEEAMTSVESQRHSSKKNPEKIQQETFSASLAGIQVETNSEAFYCAAEAPTAW